MQSQCWKPTWWRGQPTAPYGDGTWPHASAYSFTKGTLPGYKSEQITASNDGRNKIFKLNNFNFLFRLIVTGEFIFSSSYDKTVKAWVFDTTTIGPGQEAESCIRDAIQCCRDFLEHGTCQLQICKGCLKLRANSMRSQSIHTTY